MGLYTVTRFGCFNVHFQWFLWVKPLRQCIYHAGQSKSFRLASSLATVHDSLQKPSNNIT